jgi:hypothetical protein
MPKERPKMEANEIICPQCGLANNELAESCVQCGIIFIKRPAMSTHTIQNDHKKKAIEEAEAMLNDTQPSPESDAFEDGPVKRPDPHEDTLEMQIPKEETTDMKLEAELPEEPKPEADKNSMHQEIETEAIEAAMETVDGTVDSEALFLSEVNTGKSVETATSETAQKAIGLPSAAEKAYDQSGETLYSKAAKEAVQNYRPEALPIKPFPADNPVAESQKKETRKEGESVEVKAETGEVAETETAITEVVEPVNAEEHSIPAAAAPPAEQKNQSEEKPESTIAEAAPVKAAAAPDANATIEMPIELVEEHTPEDQQAEKAKQDALIKQQEAQAKAEALEKEKAAQAVALKKKKLARAQAEALKKQKAAQARAEALKKKEEAKAKAQASKKQGTTQARADALKKQKAAQAKAEASSQEVQRASTGLSQAAAASMNHYERLLGLLKRYKGKAIGINYDNSSEIREAELVDANEEFFSVRVKDKKLQYSYPLKTILTIVEGQEGVETGEGDKKVKFDAVIKVYPLVLS